MDVVLRNDWRNWCDGDRQDSRYARLCDGKRQLGVENMTALGLGLIAAALALLLNEAHLFPGGVIGAGAGVSAIGGERPIGLISGSR